MFDLVLYTTVNVLREMFLKNFYSKQCTIWNTNSILLITCSFEKISEAAFQRCSQEKMFFKYAANL